MAARRFPRSFASLEAIFAFIRERFAAEGLDSERAWDLDLIAEELFTNMVKYSASGSNEVEISLDWAAPVLTMWLREFDVERWDVSKAPAVNAAAPLRERRAGGLGLHLVHQLADRVEYAYENRCSTITVTKRLAP